MCMRNKENCVGAGCYRTVWSSVVFPKDRCHLAHSTGKPCERWVCTARNVPWLCGTCSDTTRLSLSHVDGHAATPTQPNDPRPRYAQASHPQQRPRNKATDAPYMQNAQVLDERTYVRAAVIFGCDAEEAREYYHYENYGEIPEAAQAGPSEVQGPDEAVTESTSASAAQPADETIEPPSPSASPADEPVPPPPSHWLWGLPPPRNYTTGEEFNVDILVGGYDEDSYVQAALAFGGEEVDARDYWQSIRTAIEITGGGPSS